MGLQTDKLLKGYDYILPKNLIAQKPISPRYNARLLVYKRESSTLPSPKLGEGQGRGLNVCFDTFFNLPAHLPKNAVLVFNQTKVIPARLPLYKETGGKIEVLYIGKDTRHIKVLCNKKLSLNSKVLLTHGRELREYFLIVKKIKGIYFLKPNFPISKINAIFKRHGLTPLPPYIKNSPLTEKQRRQAYQTVFAKTGESVAAPTASLHFTPKLMAKLKKHGIAVKFVRLDVNLGTFAPLREEQIKTQKLHKENYFINPQTAKFILAAKQQGRPIIAVGTTVARTLESYAKSKNLTGSTDLFITPGYKFKIIDGLITNFHVPKSSLLMLVSALTGRKKLLKLYNFAIKNRFRFFSFGDGMLII